MWFLKSRNRILYVSVKPNGSRVRIIYTEEQTALQNREKIKEIYDRQVDRVYRTAMVFMMGSSLICFLIDESRITQNKSNKTDLVSEM